MRFITDANGIVEEKYSFDAWGRRRNPVTGAPYLLPSFGGAGGGLYRGYTGHEHLDEFGLINMNGRVYDPALALFLSPDNYVQAPDFTQNFNRYAYCLNNPMMYTDPSGEFWWLLAIAGAYIGGVANNGGELNPFEWNWKDPSTYFGIAFGGAMGAAMGYWMMPGNAAAFGLNFGVSTPYAQIAIAGVAGAYALGKGTDWNWDLHWSTSAGGGGCIHLDNKPHTNPEENVDRAINKVRQEYFERQLIYKQNKKNADERLQAILNHDDDPLPGWAWGTSRDLTVTDYPINLLDPEWKGYAEETGKIRYNGQELPFLAQGEASGVEGSFSLQNVYTIKTLDGFTGINDFKGETISYNFSIGVVGVSIFTDYNGPYEAMGKKYIGLKLGVGYGGFFSVTITNTRGLYGH